MNEVTNVQILRKPLPEAIETLREVRRLFRIHQEGMARKAEFEDAQCKLESRIEIDGKSA